MKETPNLAFAFGLPPEAVVRYFASKKNYVPTHWRQISDDTHRRAFTAARITSMDVAMALRAAVDRAINDGITLSEFKRTLTPRLQALGWWGRSEFINKDGEWFEGMLGSPRRLEIIYAENIIRSHAAGRREQMMENKKNRPYWQWIHGASKIPRQSHLALDRRVFKCDDPIWSALHSCREYGCKCSARALSQADIDEEGLSVESSKKYTSEAEGTDANGNPVIRHYVKMPGMQSDIEVDPRLVERSAQGDLTALALEKAAVASPILASRVIGRVLSYPEILFGYQDDFSLWAGAALEYQRRNIGAVFNIGGYHESIVENMARLKYPLDTAVIYIHDFRVYHGNRPEPGRTPLPWDRFVKLPWLILTAEVAVLDTSVGVNPAVIYFKKNDTGWDKIITVANTEISTKIDLDQKKRMLRGNFYTTSHTITKEEGAIIARNNEIYPVLYGGW